MDLQLEKNKSLIASAGFGIEAFRVEVFRDSGVGAMIQILLKFLIICPDPTGDAGLQVFGLLLPRTVFVLMMLLSITKCGRAATVAAGWQSRRHRSHIDHAARTAGTEEGQEGLVRLSEAEKVVSL